MQPVPDYFAIALIHYGMTLGLCGLGIVISWYLMRIGKPIIARIFGGLGFAFSLITTWPVISSAFVSPSLLRIAMSVLATCLLDAYFVVVLVRPRQSRPIIGDIRDQK